MKLRVNVGLVLKGPDGKTKHIDACHNVTVTAGLAALAAYIVADPPGTTPFFKFVAIGTDGSEAFNSDTALAAEVGTRQASVPTSSGAVATYSVTFAAGNGTGTIRELGLFDLSSAGVLFARASDFTEFVKGGGDLLEVVWQLTFE